MSKIKKFIDSLYAARKRTGVVFAEGDLKKILFGFQEEGIFAVDCCDCINDGVLMTDDLLINKISCISSGEAKVILNMELFVAPRMSEEYLDNLIRKLSIEEPLKPIIFLFYSRKIFTKFRNFYKLNQLNKNHILELTGSEN